MSLTVLPPRARCIHITDGIVPCHCPWFNAPSLTLLDHDQLSCVECGHGIHAHVDYESKVVYHNPATHCAAFAQKTHKSQACTCSAQLFDHEPIVNVYYRSIALSHSPAPFASSLNSLPSSTTNSAFDDATLAITLTPIPSTTSSEPISMLFAPVPAPFHSNSISRFSQGDAYTFVSHQQSDTSLDHNLAGGPAVHHAPEGYYDYQSHSIGFNGAPSTGPYT